MNSGLDASNAKFKRNQTFTLPVKRVAQPYKLPATSPITKNPANWRGFRSSVGLELAVLALLALTAAMLLARLVITALLLLTRLMIAALLLLTGLLIAALLLLTGFLVGILILVLRHNLISPTLFGFGTRSLPSRLSRQ
jgi:hypothetical protein